MTARSLLRRNLEHFRRTHLAIVSGVMIGTAVIAGALIVGDSVRDSLRQMSLDRLGRIDHALAGMRFVRENLAAELQGSSPLATDVAPALMFRGALEFTTSAPFAEIRRAGQIEIFGADQRLWNLSDAGQVAPPGEGEIVLSPPVADQLKIKTGDTVSLLLEVPSFIPRESLLGERNETTTELPLKVSGILPEQSGLARLGLNPTQQLPANVFVNLGELQSAIGVAAVARSRSHPVAKPSRVNALFIAAEQSPQAAAISFDAAADLTRDLQRIWTLSDLGLRLVENSDHGYLSLESEQLYLDDEISRAALDVAHEMKLHTSPVLVYLVNEIQPVGEPERHAMYTVIAGIEPSESPPFGPFEFDASPLPLEGDRVYVNDWLAEDVQVRSGDRLRVTWHVVGDRGDLPESEHEFQVAGIVRLSGPANDRRYAPEVPGVTDARTYNDWREPFPLKKDKITPRDDEYWEEYRATPKLFISLKRARELWNSRYGSLTSVRLAPATGQSLEELKEQFASRLLGRLEAAPLGLAVQPVKEIGLLAAMGTTDFAGLFFGFSLFLIFSAMLLIALLFRLGMEQRLSERGLLLALGFRPGQLRRLYLTEGSVLILTGCLLGSLAAVGYAALMIYGLKTWWYGAIGTRFLFVSVHPRSVLIGTALAACTALGAIWWGQRLRRGTSVRQMLAGELADESGTNSGRWSGRLAGLCLGGSGLLCLLGLGELIPATEAFAGLSWRVVLCFAAGGGLLAGLMALFSALISRSAGNLSTGGRIGGRRIHGERELGWRNAARHRSRSVLTTGLIACATFLLVVVAAARVDPLQQRPRNDSGNGGFTLVAESGTPLLFDLNTPQGQARLGFDPLNASETALLRQATFFPFRVRPGENASCLNLYQTQLPTILGVPEDVIRNFTEQQRFRFADTPGNHPWELLNEALPEGRIPVLGDMNTLLYSLHKGIGDTVELTGDGTAPRLLEIRGMLSNSLFQGVLLMSERNFRQLFPEISGYRFFLAETRPTDSAGEISGLLETRLAPYGLDVEPAGLRLARFLSVQNTYLSTFQTLGGLGLLLGTIGLGTVMLRNVLERRKELSLLRAIGFRNMQVARIVLWENAVLLGAGLAAGTVAAAVAMQPHLGQSGTSVPYGSLLWLLAGVFALGMLSALLAVRAALRAPIVATLRDD